MKYRNIIIIGVLSGTLISVIGFGNARFAKTQQELGKIKEAIYHERMLSKQADENKSLEETGLDNKTVNTEELDDYRIKSFKPITESQESSVSENKKDESDVKN